MKIYIIRHGQTDLNIQRRMQGRKGLPLNATGIKQAESLAAKLRGICFAAVYSSPQERALQTAEIALGLSRGAIATDERLQPYDVGSADNLVIDENMHLLKSLLPDPAFYSGVEDVSAFVKRIFGFMDEIKNRYGGDDVSVAVAGHKCTTGCIDCWFNGMPADGDFFSRSVGNGECRVYEIKS